MKNTLALRLSISGLLIAIGVAIPMFSPLKISLPPASFTLASHVAIFVAMFLSPGMAVSVALGTAAGFFLGSWPPVVVLRAMSHLLFATLGAFYLRRVPATRQNPVSLRIFSFFVALLHGLGELVVVSLFYGWGRMGEAYYQSGFFFSVVMLVGVGTIAHSMVDFEIAHAVLAGLSRVGGFDKILAQEA